MLRIHDEMLDVIRSMRGALGAIDKRDADLARQLRRAASSVVLNIAEGSGSFGRVRTVRYRTALGSARETLACLQTAEAFGYVQHHFEHDARQRESNHRSSRTSRGINPLAPAFVPSPHTP